MRIAVSADEGRGLDSAISPHFGRCPYFILVEMEGHEVKTVQNVDNPYYAQHQPGQVPGFINSLGADVMLTGGMGGRAISFFQQYNIQPVTGAYGTVRHSIEQYLGGALKDAAPCRESIAHGHGDDDGHYEKDEIGRLKEEADMLEQQLGEVITRLDNLDD
ncbi:MAG: NifB/NifX family molybdenum-iron cluster-binding protein [Anaerolineae bacterium]|nr:NifB/NifX family molybdenum-iron cluster-binding protein [Anaerolineae bacterium]